MADMGQKCFDKFVMNKADVVLGKTICSFTLLLLFCMDMDYENND